MSNNTDHDHTAADYAEIIDAIARALWLSAYSDGIERQDITGPAPGAQEDWDDYAPETPASVRPIAVRIADGLALLGRGTLVDLCDEWREATGQSADRFGHCVGMMWLGHGVGLGDDLPYSSDYKVPDVGYGEYYILDCYDLPEGVESVEMIRVDDLTVRVLKIDDVLTIDIEDETGEQLDILVNGVSQRPI